MYHQWEGTYMYAHWALVSIKGQRTVAGFYAKKGKSKLTCLPPYYVCKCCIRIMCVNVCVRSMCAYVNICGLMCVNVCKCMSKYHALVRGIPPTTCSNHTGNKLSAHSHTFLDYRHTSGIARNASRGSPLQKKGPTKRYYTIISQK